MKQSIGRVTILAVALYATIAFLSGCASLPSSTQNKGLIAPKAAQKTVQKTTRKSTRSLHKSEIVAELKSVIADTDVQEQKDVASPTLLTVESREPASGGDARKAGLAEGPSPASRVSDELITSEPAQSSNAIEFKRLSMPDSSKFNLSSDTEAPLIFDIPVTYNDRVRNWIRYFQTTGRSSFRRWLERSARFQPLIQYELTQAGLPQDLVYVAMIESGFSNVAVSHANAMGMWQFIAPTGRRYGLKVEWWIDERKDFTKATKAAIRYMQDLYSQFDSWYLVAASYNMGENGVRRLIKKYGTNNFWELADLGALPRETRDYVPKILAATLISKAPALYGFRDLEYQMPLSYEVVLVPGGVDLINLANYLGVSEKYLKDLNPELTKGFIPRYIANHRIRVPKGSATTVSQYVRLRSSSVAN